MLAFPFAKINLGLHVTARRPDGYHDIETVFYPVKLCDVLEIIPSSDGKTSFSSSGIIIPGDEKSNLCLKAYHLMKEKMPDMPAVKIHLQKIIPIGAGLGGGSSDASFTLRLLNEMFEAGFREEELMEMAANIGSDCAFFIQDKPAFASGRGEILSPLPAILRGSYMVLVYPHLHVSTAMAYGGVTPAQALCQLKELYMSPLAQWKANMKNDFEPGIFSKFPLIATLKEQLYESGAFYASMSGSGSSVFGIFEDEPELEKEDFKGCFFWKGML